MHTSADCEGLDPEEDAAGCSLALSRLPTSAKRCNTSSPALPCLLLATGGTGPRGPVPGPPRPPGSSLALSRTKPAARTAGTPLQALPCWPPTLRGPGRSSPALSCLPAATSGLPRSSLALSHMNAEAGTALELGSPLEEAGSVPWPASLALSVLAALCPGAEALL